MSQGQSAGEISVTLSALTKDFQRDMQAALKSVVSWRETVKELGELAQKSFETISSVIDASSQAAVESVRAHQQLAAAAQASGRAHDTGALEKYAGSLQRLTNFDDEATIGAMSLLTMFQLSDSSIATLTPRVQDLAEFLGMDLATAARMVGRSIESGTNAMQRMGIVMDPVQEAAFKLASNEERVAMMADLLNTKVGGVAKALVDPFKQLSNATGNLYEEIGMLFRDTQVGRANLFREVIEGITDKIKELSPSAKGVAGDFVMFGQGLALVGEKASGFLFALPNMIASLRMLAPIIVPVAGGALLLGTALAGVVLVSGFLRRQWATDQDDMATKSVSITDTIRRAWDGLTSGIMAAWHAIGDTITEVVYTIMGLTHGLTAPEIKTQVEYALSLRHADDTALVDTQGREVSGSSLTEATKAGVADSFAAEAKASWKEGIAGFADMFSGLFRAVIPTGSMSTQIPQSIQSQMGLRGSAGYEAGALDYQALKDLHFASLVRAAFDPIHAALLEARDQSLASAGALAGAVEENGQVYVAVAENSLTLADRLEAILGAVFGPQFAMRIATLGASLFASVARVASSVGTSIATAGGKFGALVTDMVKGFQAGGIWGALGAAISNIVTKSKNFERQVAYLDQVFGQIVTAFEPVVSAMGPATEVIGSAIEGLLTIFTPALKGFGTISRWAGQTMAMVGIGIGNIFRVLSQVWNAIVGAIQGLLKGLSNIPFLGFLEDWASKMNSWKVNIDGIDSAIAGMHEALNGNNAAIEEAAVANEKAAKAAESLANIPQGYKVALARFNAISVTGNPSAAQGAGGVYSTSNTTIENLTVVSSDPERMYDQIQKVAARRNLSRTGTRLAALGTPYSTVAATVR